MRQKLSLLFLLVPLIITACSTPQDTLADTEDTVQTSATPLSYPPQGYTLKWADEFGDSSIDTSKWNFRTDVKLQSAQRAQNVTEGGGTAIIHMKKESYNGKSYTGGGLVSKRRFRYGYYEARMKLFAGDGWHQSFWAMRGDGSTTLDNPEKRTEIDGVEFDSNRQSENHSGIVLWDEPGLKSTLNCGSSRYYSLGFDATQSYHVYGFEWTEQQVKYYVDGSLKCTLNYPPTAHEHDAINIWLTSIAYEGLAGNVDDASLPGEMRVGHARFYQRDIYIDNGDAEYSESGAWSTSNLEGYSYSSSRYSCLSGASATWRPDIISAGSYRVYVYKVVHSSSDTDARIDIRHNGTTTSKRLDFTSGSRGWVDLGSYYFATGTNGFVRNTRSNGCARGDMVKFVKVN